MHISSGCNKLGFCVFIRPWNMFYTPWGCSRCTPSSVWQVMAVFWLASSWRRSRGEISQCAQGQRVVFTACCYLGMQSLQMCIIPLENSRPWSLHKKHLLASSCQTMFSQQKSRLLSINTLLKQNLAEINVLNIVIGSGYVNLPISLKCTK